jgi:hypothetical protein
VKTGRALVIVSFDVTTEHRRLVARCLGRPGDSASNEEMRAYLKLHGERGLDVPETPLLAAAPAVSVAGGPPELIETRAGAT